MLLRKARELHQHGDLFLWGNNRYGKIDRSTDPRSNYYVPKLVERYANYKVTQLALGGRHTIAVAKRFTQKDEKIRFTRMTTETEKIISEQPEQAAAIPDENAFVMTNDQVPSDEALTDPDQCISSSYDYISPAAEERVPRNETATGRLTSGRQVLERHDREIQAACQSIHRNHWDVPWKRSSLPYCCEKYVPKDNTLCANPYPINLAALGQHGTRKAPEEAGCQKNDFTCHPTEKLKQIQRQKNVEKRSSSMTTALMQLDSAAKESQNWVANKQPCLKKTLHSSTYDGALQFSSNEKGDRILDFHEKAELTKNKQIAERENAKPVIEVKLILS
ncbi:RCC1 domain containing protein [Trichuris trichiura]|uniref:RCC1 domain containing protein n=1 Tax=Trichuris trichiura TaxID=36087 RepID=A0A077Z9K3_TRITR|nr:RCC1 domain containing protein [Trichuris trichiura]